MIEAVRKRWVRISIWMTLAVYVVILFTLTHIPKPPGILERQNDKTLHFCAYLTLGALVYASAAIALSPRVPAGVISLFACGLFAAFDELTQPMFGRTLDFYDWRADMLGLIVAMTLMSFSRFTCARMSPLLFGK